jgi:hypothetical protein
MHGTTVEEMLTGFHHYFFSIEHVAGPNNEAYCNPTKEVPPARRLEHVPTLDGEAKQSS